MHALSACQYYKILAIALEVIHFCKAKGRTTHPLGKQRPLKNPVNASHISAKYKLQNVYQRLNLHTKNAGNLRNPGGIATMRFKIHQKHPLRNRGVDHLSR